MTNKENPYPEHMVDEASGVIFPNEKHRIWQEGFDAGYALRPTRPILPTEKDIYNALYNGGKPITNKAEKAEILHNLCLEALHIENLRQENESLRNAK